jgi:hypothetical protein
LTSEIKEEEVLVGLAALTTGYLIGEVILNTIQHHPKILTSLGLQHVVGRGNSAIEACLAR